MKMSENVSLILWVLYNQNNGLKGLVTILSDFFPITVHVLLSFYPPCKKKQSFKYSLWANSFLQDWLTGISVVRTASMTLIPGTFSGWGSVRIRPKGVAYVYLGLLLPCVSIVSWVSFSVGLGLGHLQWCLKDCEPVRIFSSIKE